MLLFSTLISFNSYGEWKEITRDFGGLIHYVKIDTINEHNGYVYYWKMIDGINWDDGYRSVLMYLQGDCGIKRQKIISYVLHKQLMGKGQGDQYDGDGQWDYPTPKSVSQEIMNFVCD